MLTGGVGAIVGGMAGGNQVETTVIITTRDGKQGIARANGPMMDAIRGHLFEAARTQGHFSENTSKSIFRKLIAIAMIFLGGSVVLGGVLTFIEKKSLPDTTELIVLALAILLAYGGIRFWKSGK